ncbi:hypothetical protein TWF506_006283 [Arthrobotrys conoides]|uniref:Uncharacterized protein n=1 Tax=Arthrobotrys conoides TaxID=74498 RepID=A0AAN8NH13_9PEZI
MQLNNHDNAPQDADAEDNVEMMLVDSPTLSPQTTALEAANGLTVNQSSHPSLFSEVSLFDHYLYSFRTPSPTSPIKRPASASPIRSFDLLSSLGPKRPRFDLLFGSQTIDPKILDLNENLPYSSDSDSMDFNFNTNTREYRRFLFRGFPPESRDILGDDSEYAISEEERQLVDALALSKLYPQKKLVLTDAEKQVKANLPLRTFSCSTPTFEDYTNVLIINNQEASNMAVAYVQSLAQADLSETEKEELQKKSASKFELQISWDKIMGHLKKVQLDRNNKLEWTDLGLPSSELVKIRSSKSMPNLKIVASVKTKVPGADLKQEGKCQEGEFLEMAQKLADEKKSTFVAAKKSGLPILAAGITHTDLTAKQHAKDENKKAEMLEVRSKYKITPRSPTPPPNAPGTSSGQKSQTDGESVSFFAHTQRYNKESKKGAENSFTKEKEMREAIRRAHEEYNTEAFHKRQHSIWHSMPPIQRKINSWEKVPRDEHKYYTFCIREICDAAPEQRVQFIEHNKLVEASGQRKGDFQYEPNDPFGLDTYLDDNPLIREGEDLGEYLK